MAAEEQEESPFDWELDEDICFFILGHVERMQKEAQNKKHKASKRKLYREAAEVIGQLGHMLEIGMHRGAAKRYEEGR